MKKYIIAMTLALVALTACEQQWDDVPARVPATDESMGAEYQYMTVNAFKDKYFYSVLPAPAGNVKSVTIPDKVYLKTKVISSDELVQKLFEKYAQKIGKDLKKLKFIFDGYVISGDETCESLELENNFIIDVQSM